MNVIEHLLTCLSEEAHEVGKDTCKAIRFGLQDHDPNQMVRVTNEEKIIVEANHLIAIMDMLVDQGAIRGTWQSGSIQAAKQKRVIEMMDYARERRTLD